MITGIVFDLDGTLVDSRADIAMAANHALKTHGYPTLPEHVIATYVGDGAHRLIERASKLPSTAPEFSDLLDSFLEYYTAHAADSTLPMVGAEATLRALHPFPIALCTNKPRQTTTALLEAFRWEPLFDCVVAGGDLTRLKPDPAPLQHIAAQLGVEASTLVMVGDGPQDVECGKAVHCTTVGIVGGMISRQRLLDSKPDFLIEELAQLPLLLHELCQAM